MASEPEETVQDEESKAPEKVEKKVKAAKPKKPPSQKQPGKEH